MITSKPLIAATEVGDFLSQNKIRYALIGGLAVQIWGEARLTIDVDFTVDISLALPGYEDEMLDRASEYELEPGKTIYFCSAEDLIIHKAVAGRPQDIVDIQGIVFRQGTKLDINIIRTWLSQFSEVLSTPEVVDRFERIWEEYSKG